MMKTTKNARALRGRKNRQKWPFLGLFGLVDFSKFTPHFRGRGIYGAHQNFGKNSVFDPTEGGDSSDPKMAKNRVF